MNERFEKRLEEKKKIAQYAYKYAAGEYTLIREIIKSNNRNFKIGKTEEEAELGWDDMQNTMTLIPVILFCHYQTIELLIKAFCGLFGKYKNRHDTEDFFEKFKSFYCKEKEKELIALFDKYIGENKIPLIQKYMEINEIENISYLYNTLRYTDAIKGKNTTLLPLQCPEAFKSGVDSSVHALKEMQDDVKRMIELSAQLWNAIEQGAYKDELEEAQKLLSC